MNILALDTSTEYLSLALLLADGDHQRIHERNLHAGQTHSQQVLPLLRELLDEAGLSMQQLHGIAFGAGPGSFTGLRIACGIAQGLAFGAGLPVIGVSTLLALAQNSTASRVIACLDARMGEVYHAAYARQDEHWLEVSAPGLYAPEAVPAVDGQGWSGVGTGWQVYADSLAQVYAGQLDSARLATEMQAPLAAEHPRALSIAQLALPLFMAGQGRPAAEAAPVYIRNKVALKMSERVAR